MHSAVLCLASAQWSHSWSSRWIDTSWSLALWLPSALCHANAPWSYSPLRGCTQWAGVCLLSSDGVSEARTCSHAQTAGRYWMLSSRSGAYVPEGLLTSCSWDYMTFSPSVRAYTMLLFIFVFFIPLFVIMYCYIFIFRAIRDTNRWLLVLLTVTWVALRIKVFRA